MASLRVSAWSGILALVPVATSALIGSAADQESMRLPGWIQSIGDDRGDGVRPAAAASAGRPVSPTTRHVGGVVEDATVHLPVADWSKPKAAAESPARPRRTAVAEKPPASPPPAAGFRRWVTEQMAALPKPPSLLPSATLATKTEPPAAGEQPGSEHEPPAGIPAPPAVAPDEMPTLSIDPASFHGAHPGRTTRSELEQVWGPGEDVPGEEGVAAWQIEPFERVEASFSGDTVATISIKLATPMSVGDLASQLEIADLRTVSVLDEEGTTIGRAYPERGVILSVEPGTDQANAILIEPLDADAFVLRAEGELDTCSAYAVADLQYAIEIDPRHVRAHRLLLTATADQGQWQRALEIAEAAVELDPSDPWIRFKHATVLLALDRPDDAKATVQAVAASREESPLLAAQRERIQGRIALAGPAADHRASVEHFAEAIRLAAPLLSRPSPAVQAAVREILLDAHLGTALSIAEGTWQQKSRVIPKWIARSEAVVTDYQGTDRDRQVLELQLCRGALAVAAASTESVEPLPWVKRLLELRDAMNDTVADPWRRRQIDWDVGQGLADAITAAQLRGDASDMLDNATLTAAYLERGAEHRQLTAAEQKELGDLMFRIGILHSLQRGDHATAVTWFDRTIPLWSVNDRFERDGELGRLGESYVSMAISYWQVARREDALELSRRGVDLMVASVDAGQLEERALAIAYGNLSTMYAEQGDEERSQSYAEMASRAETTGGTLR